MKGFHSFLCSVERIVARWQKKKKEKKKKCNPEIFRFYYATPGIAFDFCSTYLVFRDDFQLTAALFYLVLK